MNSLDNVFENVMVSIEKDFFNESSIKDVTNIILNLLDEQNLKSITAKLNSEVFEIDIISADDETIERSGKIYPDILPSIFELLDKISIDPIDVSDINFKKDNFNIQVNVDLVDGGYIEFEDENDKIVRTKYAFKKADINENKRFMNNKSLILEQPQLNQELVILYRDKKELLPLLYNFLDEENIEYKATKNGCLISKDDIINIKSILDNFSKNRIKYKIIDNEVVTETVVESNYSKLVGIDFENTSTNEKRVIVFEDRYARQIYNMIKTGDEANVNFEVFSITESDIREEGGNRVYFDYYTGTNIEIINEKRILF